jgi:hypothetical protein
MVRLTVNNPSNNLKISIDSHSYWAYPFTLICDGGVESPISPGEIWL